MILLYLDRKDGTTVKIVDEKPFNIEFTCKGCGSMLVAKADDIRIGYFGANYGGERPVRGYRVQCPVCETDTRIDDEKVPPKVRTMAQLKERD